MKDHKSVLIQLYPPVSYNIKGNQFQLQCQVDGAAFDRIQWSAERIKDAISPETSLTMLQDWERILDMDMDMDMDMGMPYQYRVARVISKLNSLGGLSISYFVDLAKSAGYQITITELEPFRAGLNIAGDRLGLEDIIYHWVVNIVNGSQSIIHFRAGMSCANERISEYHDDIIESLFIDLKPAHTFVSFIYGE